MTEVEALGIGLTAQSFEVAINRLLDRARSGPKARAHFVNVHNLIEARRDRQLREVFAQAFMRCTDGMPLVWIERRHGVSDAERVSGPDVMLSLLDHGRALGLRHYFLGGRPGVAAALSESLARRLPGVLIVGHHAPPMRPSHTIEDSSVIESINSLEPDVIWVGLGAPKQEFWAADHQAQLNANLIVPVGAAFDFLSGRVPRAPNWMRRSGLEWLFRLAMDPRRLAGRYLTTNLAFLALLARDKLRRRPAAVADVDWMIRRSWIGQRIGWLRRRSPSAYAALRGAYRFVTSPLSRGGLDPYQRRAANDFLRHTPPALLKRGVLEIGSDTEGRVLRYLVDRGVPDVSGINPVWRVADAERIKRISGARTVLPVDLLAADMPSGSFGAIFSVAVFEHLSDFEACLDKMHDLLAPGGEVYGAFGPVWSSSLGHHIFVDRGPIQLRHWDPRRNPVADHAHLLRSRDELHADLASTQDSDVADLAVQWIYDSPDLNRNFFDDYVRAFESSRFRLVRLETEKEYLADPKLRELRSRYPGNSTFDVRNATVVLKRTD